MTNEQANKNYLHYIIMLLTLIVTLVFFFLQLFSVADETKAYLQLKVEGTLYCCF